MALWTNWEELGRGRHLRRGPHHFPWGLWLITRLSAPPVFRGLTGEDGDGHLAYSGERVAREVASVVVRPAGLIE